MSAVNRTNNIAISILEDGYIIKARVPDGHYIEGYPLTLYEELLLVGFLHEAKLCGLIQEVRLSVNETEFVLNATT